MAVLGQERLQAKLLVAHRSNPAVATGLSEAILRPQQMKLQPCAQPRIARPAQPAPGPQQARTQALQAQSDFGMERGRISDFAFPSLLHFSAPESGDMVTWLWCWSAERRFGGSIPPRYLGLETGDFGGDKLSGLPRYVEEADALETGKLGGLVFRARKWISEHCKHLDERIWRTQDTKNALFGVRRFWRFLLQNGAVTKR